MNALTVVVAGLILPLLALALAWLPNPLDRTTSASRSRRIATVVCAALSFAASAYVTTAVIQQQKRDVAQVAFEEWRTGVESQARAIHSWWMANTTMVGANTPQMDVEKFSPAQIHESSLLVTQTLQLLFVMFAAHAVYCSAEGVILTDEGLSSTQGRAQEISSTLERLRNERDMPALGATTRSAWTEVPTLCELARRLLVGGLDEAVLRERVRFNADPSSWSAPLDPAKAKALTASFR